MKKLLFLWSMLSMGVVCGMDKPYQLAISTIDRLDNSLPLAPSVIDQIRVLVGLDNDNFFCVGEILDANPDLLHGEKDALRKTIDSTFAKKFIQIPSSSPYFWHMKKLVYGGFDLNFCNEKTGRSLLSAAVLCSDNKYVDLLNAGVDLNRSDNDGHTPVDYAAIIGDFIKVLTLVECGAIVNGGTCLKFDGHKMHKLLTYFFEQQNCVDCYTHHFDLLDIPCHKKHPQWYMCIPCYNNRIEAKQGCPVCLYSGENRS